jgi:uncharacterized protein with NRDE domain
LTVCLLIMLAQTHPGFPLVVAANRDELLDRPAVAMTVLREARPRVLGGRDELAGGTWLAVNDAGVVAGLTNRPATKDPAKRSRGELPIALASHTSAAAAVEAFATELRPSDYNPAWLLVGDREAAFAVDMTGGDSPEIEPLRPGIHILENRALGAASPKVDHVRHLLEGVERLPGDALIRRLQAVLGDHNVPEGHIAAAEGSTVEVPQEVKAACVHTERYGTRWSGIVTVSASPDDAPTFRYAEGSACRASWLCCRPEKSLAEPVSGTDRHGTGVYGNGPGNAGRSGRYGKPKSG